MRENGASDENDYNDSSAHEHFYLFPVAGHK